MESPRRRSLTPLCTAALAALLATSCSRWPHDLNPASPSTPETPLPSPTNAQLAGIEMADDSTAFAIDTRGRLLLSTNCGSSWIISCRPAPASYGLSQRRLSALSCPSPSTAFAVGDSAGNGLILRTTDGGRSWNQLHFPGNQLTAIDMCSPFEGMITGMHRISPYSDEYRQSILRTTDGGDSWIEFQPAGSSWLRGIDVIDPLRAVAVGDSSILFTSDGGLVWTNEWRVPAFAQPHIFRSVSFISSLVGLVLLHRVPYSDPTNYNFWGAPEYVGVITSDAGGRWDTLATWSDSYLGIFRVRKTPGGPWLGVGREGRLVVFLGASFTIERFTAGHHANPSPHLIDFSFASTSVGMIATGYEGYVDHGSILRTTDAGMSWTEVDVVVGER